VWTTVAKSLLLCGALNVAQQYPAGAQEAVDLLGNHHDSPVFYEIQPTPYFLVDNVELLHQNKLKLWHFPVTDVTDFDWKTAEFTDLSWWIQIEELRFLIPLIKSGDEADWELARRWFMSWYESNRGDQKASRTRWREPMSAAYRGMVLVFFLKTEESRDSVDTDLRAKLREVIHQHQEFLAMPGHFNSNSNHGLVESFGLLEVTRVFPDTENENLGLDRLVTMARKSVSTLGTHKEHSPAYHFAFLNWLDKFSTYLAGQSHLDPAKLAVLVDYAARMRDASYYMRDHDGIIPEVGDTDSMNVSFRYPQYWDVGMAGAPPVFHDEEAGFSVFKGKRRYVLYSITSVQPELPYHYHNDVMSVYYRYKGETILGDPGKYQYTRSAMRNYFTSMQAHSSLVPSDWKGAVFGTGAVRLARATGVSDSAGADRLSAAIEYEGLELERTVVIPRRASGIIVSDDLSTRMGARDARGRRRVGPGPGGLSHVTLVWNFGYDVFEVVPDPATAPGGNALSFDLTTKSGRRLRMTVVVTPPRRSQLKYELVRGRERPLGGWYAPKLFVKRPSYTMVAKIAFDGEATIVTRVEEVTRHFPGLRILTRGY